MKQKKLIIILSSVVLGVVLLILVLRIISDIIFPHTPPMGIANHISSHQHTERFRDYNEQIAFLFELSDKFTVYEIGTLSYPEYPDFPEYKMYKLSYGKTETADTINYLFISGMHGDEPAPVYAMRDFIQYLDSFDLLDNITMDFFVILNPYGFEYNCTYNAPGININRDFINFESLEVKYMMESIKDKTYTAVYDFHENPSAKGFYLYYYSGKNRTIVNNILGLLQKYKVPLENEYVDVAFKAKNGAIYVPFYGKMFYLHMGKMASLALYFDRIKTGEVFVFETPTAMNIENRKVINLMLFRYLVGI